MTEIKDKVITKDAFELPTQLLKRSINQQKVLLSTFMVAVLMFGRPMIYRHSISISLRNITI